MHPQPTTDQPILIRVRTIRGPVPTPSLGPITTAEIAELAFGAFCFAVACATLAGWL